MPRRLGWTRGDGPRALVEREWLVTNGLGGYASGTLSGELTRRYHGLLVAALAVPQGRTVMVSRLDEAIAPAGRRLTPHSFRLEQGLPVWTFAWDGHVLEKRVVMPHGRNTTYVLYRAAAGRTAVRLELRPAVAARRLEDPVSAPTPSLRLIPGDGGCEVRSEVAVLHLRVHGARTAFVDDPHSDTQFYALEAARGYDARGKVWTPGVFEVELDASGEACLVASTDERGGVQPATEVTAVEAQRRSALLTRLRGAAARGDAPELALAADQFVVRPSVRAGESARARARGAGLRTVIAGYHWFTDWGRDTMISLEGLTLATRRPDAAAEVLGTFAAHVRNGLIPNRFPEGRDAGLYNTADATLWYFHALDRYVAATGDRRTLTDLLPVLHDVVAWHLRGTDFHIGVDPHDGLLRQGEQGYPLTWMDAKVGDGVVTPRRGKAVEIQALWYNALRLLERWTRTEEDDARRASGYADLAARVQASFNARFWCMAAGHLYDVVDGEDGTDDASCRPNQILAFSLPHPVLAPARWREVLDVVTERLLTPMGLRSLAPGSAGYCARYDGDLRSRDAAYHQGTVWGWLIGPYIDAWVRVHGDPGAARPLLEGLLDHLGEAGIGQMSEIFDAEAPYTPRGCIAQAWTVAEVMRCLVLTEPGDRDA